MTLWKLQRQAAGSILAGRVLMLSWITLTAAVSVYAQDYDVFVKRKDSPLGIPAFTLAADPEQLFACSEDGADMLDPVTLDIGSYMGFSNEVTLTFDPALPAGFSGSITPMMVTPAVPPAHSTVDLTVTGAAVVGDHTITVLGAAQGTDAMSVEINVNVADAAPPGTTLLTPPDGAVDVLPQPSMAWIAIAQATHYYFEVATDPAFTNVVLSGTTELEPYFDPTSDLPTSTRLYWRVRPSNRCGSAGFSEVFTFTTQSLPGDCPPGSVPAVYFNDDVEGGENGWSQNAIPASPGWELVSDDASNSPSHSWRADDVEFVTDQRLVSPDVILPAGVTAPTLYFYTRYNLEDSLSGDCYDGGILEYSTNSGASWSQVGNSRLVTDPYTATVDSNFGNPLAGLQAWCEVRQWSRSVVDLSGLEGESLSFRFRLGTDESNVSPVNDWRIDDVRIHSCVDVVPESTFTVNKSYDDATLTAVSVTASCTGGGSFAANPLDAAPDSPAVFSYSGYTGDPTCTAQESGVPAGYTANNADCQESKALGTGCTIANTRIMEDIFKDGFE
jgi:hypothetical protein